jgi:hypothetical protein
MGRTQTGLRLGDSLRSLDPPLKAGWKSCQAYENALRSYVSIDPKLASNQSSYEFVGRRLDRVLKPCRQQLGAPVNAAALPNVPPFRPPPPPRGTLAGDANAAAGPCLAALVDRGIEIEDRFELCESAAAELAIVRTRYPDAAEREKIAFEMLAANMHFALALAELSANTRFQDKACGNLLAAAASNNRLRAMSPVSSLPLSNLDELVAACPKAAPGKI